MEMLYLAASPEEGVAIPGLAGGSEVVALGAATLCPLSFHPLPPPPPAHTAHRPISPLPSFVARSSTEFPGVDCASSRELLA